MLNKHGKFFRKGVLKQACGEGYMLKCSNHIPQNDREYLKLGCVTRQRQFFSKYAVKSEKGRGKKKITSVRKCSCRYFLPSGSSSVPIRVCKTFFF